MLITLGMTLAPPSFLPSKRGIGAVTFYERYRRAYRRRMCARKARSRLYAYYHLNDGRRLEDGIAY